MVEATSLPDLASKLSGYRREESHEEGDYKLTLINSEYVEKESYFLII